MLFVKTVEKVIATVHSLPTGVSTGVSTNRVRSWHSGSFLGQSATQNRPFDKSYQGLIQAIQALSAPSWPVKAHKWPPSMDPYTLVPTNQNAALAKPKRQRLSRTLSVEPFAAAACRT